MTTEQIRWTSSHISSCDTPQSDFVISFSYLRILKELRNFLNYSLTLLLLFKNFN